MPISWNVIRFGNDRPTTVGAPPGGRAPRLLLQSRAGALPDPAGRLASGGEAGAGGRCPSARANAFRPPPHGRWAGGGRPRRGDRGAPRSRGGRARGDRHAERGPPEAQRVSDGRLDARPRRDPGVREAPCRRRAVGSRGRHTRGAPAAAGRRGRPRARVSRARAARADRLGRPRRGPPPRRPVVCRARQAAPTGREGDDPAAGATGRRLDPGRPGRPDRDHLPGVSGGGLRAADRAPERPRTDHARARRGGRRRHAHLEPVHPASAQGHRDPSAQAVGAGTGCVRRVAPRHAEAAGAHGDGRDPPRAGAALRGLAKVGGRASSVAAS